MNKQNKLILLEFYWKKIFKKFIYYRTAYIFIVIANYSTNFTD